MQFAQLKRMAVTLSMVGVLGACAASPPPEAVWQGPIVPTRMPTPTSAPTVASADPTTLNSIFPIETTGTLSFDTPFSGSITGEDYATLLTFDGQAGQTVDIITQAAEGEVDTYLILQAPDGRELARNDDQELDNRNAALYGVDLPETGTYIVIVSRFRQRFGATTGEFTVELREALGGFPPTDTTKLISYGVEQFGTINNDNLQQVYTFEAAAGDVIAATARTEGGNLDPTIRLTDAAGNEIAVNSDINFFTDTNAQLTDVVLPANGHYTLLVTRYNGLVGETSGQFSLMVEQTGQVPTSELSTQSDAILGFNESSTLLEQNLDMYVPEFGFYVGDVVDEQHGEVLGQTVLTFFLVPLAEDSTVEQAQLDLTRCAENGLSFEVIEAVDIYLDTITELSAQTAFEPSTTAQLLGSITDCGSLDVTESIQTVYDNQSDRIMFRLIPQGALQNDQTDAILLTDPRLSVTVSN